jgi:hypothetical protein
MSSTRVVGPAGRVHGEGTNLRTWQGKALPDARCIRRRAKTRDNDGQKRNQSSDPRNRHSAFFSDPEDDDDDDDDDEEEEEEEESGLLSLLDSTLASDFVSLVDSDPLDAGFAESEDAAAPVDPFRA